MAIIHPNNLMNTCVEDDKINPNIDENYALNL